MPRRTSTSRGCRSARAAASLARHTFPLDGDYMFKASCSRPTSAPCAGSSSRTRSSYSIDGHGCSMATVGGNADNAMSAATPPTSSRRSSAADRARERQGRAAPGGRRVPSRTGGAGRLEAAASSCATSMPATTPGCRMSPASPITGPFDASGPGDTPSRRRIFTCRRVAAADELPCARRFSPTLARRAYRRPVTERRDGPAADALSCRPAAKGASRPASRSGCAAMLANPKFVFRDRARSDERACRRRASMTHRRLRAGVAAVVLPLEQHSGRRTARRGGQRRLHTPAVLERQVRRMLADPRARALVSNFAGQWLQLRNLRSSAGQGGVPRLRRQPSAVVPARDRAALRQHHARGSQRRRSAHRGLHVRQRAAGPALRDPRRLRQPFPPRLSPTSATRTARARQHPQRTSHADRTSPVVRGKWILENMLGMPPPPPPPDVPPLEENEAWQPRDDARADGAASRNPACARCHRIMDPIGLALENFDAVGAWRTD